MAHPGNGAGRGADGATPSEQGERFRAERLREDARKAAAKAALREDEALEQRSEAASAPPPPTAHDPDASLLEVARAVLGAVQDSAASATATVGAFSSLVRADLALARASLVSGTVIGLVAAVTALTTWGLLVWLLVLGLELAGLPRWGAVGSAALLILLLTAALGLLARNRLRGTRMAATRRQWAALRHGERPA